MLNADQPENAKIEANSFMGVSERLQNSWSLNIDKILLRTYTLMA